MCGVFLFLSFAPSYLLKDSTLDPTLTGSYLFALSISVVTFSFGSAVRAAMIALRLVSFHSMRRGFFGLIQRVFIIARNLFILPVWLAYFGQSNCNSFLDIITQQKTFIGACYVVLKCFVQLWLLWDLGTALRDYTLNPTPICSAVTTEEVNDDCPVCQDRPTNPVQLPCGHIFCYDCIARWLSTKGSCPLCRADICEPKGIEFGDGSVPWITLFSAF
jgi:hypothetical protein